EDGIRDFHVTGVQTCALPIYFDSFDRLAFIREVGNPLYAALVDAHLALDIATHEDVAPLFPRPVNPLARNLFAPDFLNAHAYSKIGRASCRARVAVRVVT